MKYHGTCGRFSLMINTDLPPAAQVEIIADVSGDHKVREIAKGEYTSWSMAMSVSELEDLRYMIARSQEPEPHIIAEHERHR